MGTIGISNHAFLYDLQFWQVRRIIRGYNRRNRFTHQLLGEMIYATLHIMRDPKGKTAANIFPELFEDDEEEEEQSQPPLTDEERKELQELMKANPFLKI